MRNYVFDASALLVFFYGRDGTQRIEEILGQAETGEAAVRMCVVNWGEIYYSIWKTEGPQVADQKLEQISHLAIELVEVDVPLAKHAATLKAKYKLPYADCFAAATAQQEKARLVTSDPDFKAVQRQLKILWLR